MTNAIEQNIAHGLNAILSELRRSRIPDDNWTKDEVAAYLKMSKSTFEQRIQPRDDFPRPYSLPTSDVKGSLRWNPDHVKAWRRLQEKRQLTS